MTARERAKREQVRFQAADLSAEGATDRGVAQRLRVTRMATGRWCRAFDAGADEAGQNLRPATRADLGWHGHTPVVSVCAASSGRVSIAGLVATKPGRRTG